MIYFVCQISNNSLGTVTQVETIEDGLELIKKIVVENGVEITPEVLEEIENDYEYIDEMMQFEATPANSWGVCLGTIE